MYGFEASYSLLWEMNDAVWNDREVKDAVRPRLVVCLWMFAKWRSESHLRPLAQLQHAQLGEFVFAA